MSAEDYSIARRFALLATPMTAGYKPLTEEQFDTLCAAGLFRTNVEIKAFDNMEKGHLTRVRYLAGEVERMDDSNIQADPVYRQGYNQALRDEGAWI